MAWTDIHTDMETLWLNWPSWADSVKIEFVFSRTLWYRTAYNKIVGLHYYILYKTEEKKLYSRAFSNKQRYRTEYKTTVWCRTIQYDLQQYIMIQHSNDNTVQFTAVQNDTERCRKIHYSLQQYKLYGTVYNNIVLFTAIKIIQNLPTIQNILQ